MRAARVVLRVFLGRPDYGRAAAGAARARRSRMASARYRLERWRAGLPPDGARRR